MQLNQSEQANPPARKTLVAFSHSFGLRFGAPMLTVAIADAATRLLQAGTGQKSPSSVFFLIAVLFSTGIGDLYVGISATLLSVVCYDYFFLPPVYSFTIHRSDAPTLLLFVLVALLINGVGGRLQARTRAANQRAHALVQELTGVKDELAALNSITSAISVSLEMRVVLERLQQQLVSRLNIPCGAIFVADEEHACLKLQASWGVPETLQKEWAELPLETFHGDQPRNWTLGGRDGTAIPLTANEELQGGLYLDGITLKSELNRERSRERNPEREGDRFERTFWIALGRQIGVVIENARLYAQVCAGRERLQWLSGRLVQVQESERRQIARELHDEIGQTLTGLKLNLEMGARQSPQSAQPNLAGALVLINELMTRVRDLSLHLRPAMLDDLGLLPTLLWHFGRYSDLTGVQVCCEHTGVERRFPGGSGNGGVSHRAGRLDQCGASCPCGGSYRPSVGDKRNAGGSDCGQRLRFRRAASPGQFRHGRLDWHGRAGDPARRASIRGIHRRNGNLHHGGTAGEWLSS